MKRTNRESISGESDSGEPRESRARMPAISPWIGSGRGIWPKKQPQEGHLFIDKEKILSWNPDLIFLDGGGFGDVRQDYRKKPEFYKGLKAFQARQVYVLYPYNWYVTNVDTAAADAYAAGKILSPAIFADVDPKRKADEIYSFLLGKPVYGRMKKAFGEIGPVAF